MVLQFQPPPEGLIEGYLNRKQPLEIANEGIQGALQAYVQQQAQQQAAALAQQQKDIEMAKGMAANGKDFQDAYNQIVAARNPRPAPPTSYPLKQSALPPGDSSQMPSSPLNFQPDTGGPAQSLDPSGSPIVNHWNQSMGNGSPMMGGGPTPPMGKPLDQGSLTTSPTTDPLVQEYQKDPLAFKRQHGEAGIAKLKGQAELDNLLKDKTKGNTPYYDASGKKLFDLPPEGKIIPGSLSMENMNYVGNSEEGAPVLQDKQGNFFANGNPYSGKIRSKNSETPTSTTRSGGEFAQTVIPHIQDMRDLIKQADAKGFIGPAAGRIYGQFLAGKIGSTGNADADNLLGQLKATDSLLKTGAMKAHFGSRGGQQMYDHFSELLNSGKQSAAMMNGSLSSLEKFMQGYVNAGKGRSESTGKPSAGDPLGIR